MVFRIIIISVASIFSFMVVILGIRNLRALRKELSEFHETQRRKMELVRELDVLHRKVIEWAERHPEGTTADDPESQEIFREALQMQARVRETHPDYDDKGRSEFLLAIVKPDGAA